MTTVSVPNLNTDTFCRIRLKYVTGISLLFAGVVISCLSLNFSTYSFGFGSMAFTYKPFSSDSLNMRREPGVERILREASMKDRTVIITTLNEAWAKPNSTFDLFLESFRIGQGTKQLLNHVVVACLDDKAYARCSSLNLHCYVLNSNDTDFSGEKGFMTPDYLKMMWRRIEFLTQVLDSGYNILFTDADIMWLRNPFPRLDPKADFQIACDRFNGNSRSTYNDVNGGFTYTKSNKRTIEFYKYWYYSRLNYPRSHDQDVFNRIKHDWFITKIKLEMRFLDTVYFGGFCQLSRDINLVCTMHANCCYGLDHKAHDLGLVLHDWRKYLSTSKKHNVKKTTWSVPNKC